MGWLSGEPQWLQMCLGSGALVMSGLGGLGLVVPLWPLGLPGNRFSHFLWSPVRVGYMRLEGGVWGFSKIKSFCLRFVFSSFSAVFSAVSVCMVSSSFWQFGHVKLFVARLWVDSYDSDSFAYPVFWNYYSS